MRHAGPYGSMVAGLTALVFATGATFGALRSVVATGPSAVVAVPFGALVALWVAAFFSGGGGSVRRALRGWAVALLCAAAVAIAAASVGRVEETWLAPGWVVAWLIGACVAVGSELPNPLPMRLAATLLLGIPAVVLAVSLARVPVLGFVAGVAGLAVPLAAADAVTARSLP